MGWKDSSIVTIYAFCRMVQVTFHPFPVQYNLVCCHLLILKGRMRKMPNCPKPMSLRQPCSHQTPVYSDFLCRPDVLIFTKIHNFACTVSVVAFRVLDRVQLRAYHPHHRNQLPTTIRSVALIFPLHLPIDTVRLKFMPKHSPSAPLNVHERC